MIFNSFGIEHIPQEATRKTFIIYLEYTLIILSCVDFIVLLPQNTGKILLNCINFFSPNVYQSNGKIVYVFERQIW